MKTCSFDGCERKHQARGLCKAHYNQLLTGSQLKPLRQRLGVGATRIERFWAKVAVCGSDECWLWTEGTNSKGYGSFNAGDRSVLAHRFAYELAHGPVPPGLELDHRWTCSKRCVNPTHLRPVTRKQNGENRRGAQSNNKSSGVRGVWWYAKTSKWKAQVRHNGRGYSAGYHYTIPEAEAAVIAKRNELFTHNDRDKDASL